MSLRASDKIEQCVVNVICFLLTAAYFYVGKSKSPRAEGAIRLRDERGGTAPLRRYRGEGVTLSLPDGHMLKDLRWFSVWCDDFAVSTDTSSTSLLFSCT